MTKSNFQRRAEWIWRQRGLTSIPFGTANPLLAEEANRYVYFRHTFTLASDVIAAPVHVSADGRYQLFVNGRFVGRGPARSSPAWQCVDPYDLTPFLQPGRNVIAALAHSYGRHTAWYELPTLEHGRAFGCGGFFLQGDVIQTSTASDLGNDPICLDSGAGWRYLESTAWQRETPNGSLGFVEMYDARRAPTGWREVDFDDTAWPRPEILRVPGRNGANDIIPFPVMVPRAIPPLSEERRYASALTLLGEVNDAPDEAEIAALFAAETVTPLHQCHVAGASHLLSPDGVTTITSTGDQSVTLVLDFGQTVVGQVCFEVTGPAGAVLDFTYGELLEEDGRVHMHGGIPGFDVPPGHRLILREGRQSWSAFEMSGFRYLQVTVRGPGSVALHTVALNFSTYPVQERGAFACSDDLLTHIWQVGANTSRLCMLDGYVDCPSREQRQWMSAYSDTRISYAAFGESLLAAQLLRQMAQSQRPDGLTMMAAPGDFAVMDFTNIPDFCLHWIMSIGAYVEYVGDTHILHELYPAVVQAIGWFERHLHEDHLLTNLPHWTFVDWAAVDKQGQVTAVNAHLVATLRVVARLAEFVAHAPDALRFTALADRIAVAINRHLWDEARGVYVDARQDGRLSRRISQQSNAAVIAFGVAPRERWARIFSTILDEDRLVLTPTGDSDPAPLVFDNETDVVLAQPFYMHFVHQALRMAGKQQYILDNIRQRWGQMVAGGEQTIWETWQGTGVLSSRCHAWAATPTFDLSTDVLGISPTSPGFKTLRVAPQPGDLTWAKGAFPTPYGVVNVAWRIQDGRFFLEVTIPENTTAEVLLPGEKTAVTVGPGNHELER